MFHFSFPYFFFQANFNLLFLFSHLSKYTETSFSTRKIPIACCTDNHNLSNREKIFFHWILLVLFSCDLFTLVCVRFWWSNLDEQHKKKNTTTTQWEIETNSLSFSNANDLLSFSIIMLNCTTIYSQRGENSFFFLCFEFLWIYFSWTFFCSSVRFLKNVFVFFFR